MSSAGCFTNRRRILAEVSNTKVQYRGGRATNYNPILSTANCNPNFQVLSYESALCCTPICDIIILSGGSQLTNSLVLLSGGTILVILSGGSETTNSNNLFTSNGHADNIFSGGNENTEEDIDSNIIYSGSAECLL